MRRGMALVLALFAQAWTAASWGQPANQHPHPFQTIQSDGSVIVLSYRGDEHFEWYEDAFGYTALRVKGDYYYAVLNGTGELEPTCHRVGSIPPAQVGLVPGILPPPNVMQAKRAAAAHRMAADPPSNHGIPAGCRLIEGCIVVPETPAPQGDDGGAGQPQNGAHITSNLWPDGIVPYTFDTGVSAENQTRMRDAMEAWEAVAGVQFVPRTTEANYVRVIHGSGNWSYVGRIGGPQDLSISNWTFHFIIMHELAHALGVWHEQSRPDRDTYVQINSANIQSGMEHNFDIQAGAGTNGAYDFDSIMHYPQCAFANCVCSSSCTTITCLPPHESWQSQIGQRSHLSVGDAATMAALYGPPVADDAASMTSPANDGDAIETDSFTFAWSPGSNVTQYRLRVGLSFGAADLFDQTLAGTSADVSGLPGGGTMVFVELSSQISGDWHARSYAYLCGIDQCPGFDDNLDADNDTIPDGCDACPGFDDGFDADNDETPDGCDECPGDPLKTASGECGCGVSDADSDGDGVADCNDACPEDAAKIEPGACGCSEADIDSDGDGTADCVDLCPLAAAQIEPGLCGCGFPPADTNGDGVPDCGNGSDPGVTGGGTVQPLTDLTLICGAGGGATAMTLAAAGATGIALRLRRHRRRR